MAQSAIVVGSRPCETVFGHRLDDVRQARGWTIERLALHCRVSLSTMESWLGDGCEPLLGYAFKAACAVGYNIEDLADPSVRSLPEPQRADAPGEWTFEFKGSVCSTEFGATLRTAVTSSGRTIKDFAAEIGIPRSAVTKWVGGYSEPRLTSAMRAAVVLDLSLHGLCEGRIIQARTGPGSPARSRS